MHIMYLFHIYPQRSLNNSQIKEGYYKLVYNFKEQIQNQNLVEVEKAEEEEEVVAPSK